MSSTEDTNNGMSHYAKQVQIISAGAKLKKFNWGNLLTLYGNRDADIRILLSRIERLKKERIKITDWVNEVEEMPPATLMIARATYKSYTTMIGALEEKLNIVIELEVGE